MSEKSQPGDRQSDNQKTFARKRDPFDEADLEMGGGLGELEGTFDAATLRAIRGNNAPREKNSVSEWGSTSARYTPGAGTSKIQQSPAQVPEQGAFPERQSTDPFPTPPTNALICPTCGRDNEGTTNCAGCGRRMPF